MQYAVPDVHAYIIFQVDKNCQQGRKHNQGRAPVLRGSQVDPYGIRWVHKLVLEETEF